MLPRGVVIGHSFIKHLVRSEYSSFNLAQTFRYIKTIYRGGAVLKHLEDYTNTLAKYDVVIIVIGSNDLCDPSVSPKSFAAELLCFAQSILSTADDLGYTLPAISVVPVLHRSVDWHPRKGQRSVINYNESVDIANHYLKQYSANLFRIHLYTSPRTIDERYLHDGVHLNNQGQRLFYRYIRGALIFCSNILTNSVSHRKPKKRHNRR